MRSAKLLTKALCTAGAMLVLLVVAAAPGFAAPTLTISQLTGLTDGQTITISGGGFQANLKTIAIGECTADYTGPADCNTAGGAQFRDADANGKVSSFTIKVKIKFGNNDCSKVQCVIAGAPLPTNADAATVKANTAVYKISFGTAASASASPSATASASAGTTGDEIPKTGAGDSLPVFVLVAGTLLAAGVGVVLLVPGRRREGV